MNLCIPFFNVRVQMGGWQSDSILITIIPNRWFIYGKLSVFDFSSTDFSSLMTNCSFITYGTESTYIETYKLLFIMYNHIIIKLVWSFISRFCTLKLCSLKFIILRKNTDTTMLTPIYLLQS